MDSMTCNLSMLWHFELHNKASAGISQRPYTSNKHDLAKSWGRAQQCANKNQNEA